MKGHKDKSGKFHPHGNSRGIRSTDFEESGSSNSVSIADLEKFAREKAEYYSPERANVEFEQPDLTKNTSGFIRSGKYDSTDTTYADYEKVKIGNKTYDTKTTYYWEDSDFPHDDDIEKAQNEAIKNGDNKDDWPDYVNYMDQLFSFKLSAIRITDRGDIEVLPEGVGLGRIPIEEIQTAEEQGIRS